MKEKKHSSPEELLAKYKHLFAAKNLGFDLAKGWMSIYERLLKDIDELLGEDKTGFEFTQWKEKFGSAKFKYKISGQRAKAKPSEFKALVLARTQAAEAESEKTCIYCGRPAELRTVNSYVLSECDEHHRLREAGKAGSPYEA